MALHSSHNHSPIQHPETPQRKSTRKKNVQIYSCVTPQTRSRFWRGECLIWCGHSYTIKFMWGVLTSPWDEPIRNSIRGNWGRAFFLPPPFNLILLALTFLNINTVLVGYRQNTWTKLLQGDEVLSCSRRATAVSSVQESNIHTLGILGVWWGSGGWDVGVYRLEISIHWNHQKSLHGLDLRLWIRPGSSADVNPCISADVTQLCQVRSADTPALSLHSNSTCITACKSIC